MSHEKIEWVKDVGANDFDAAVIERSQTVPVVVDFWAPWCGPCRLLGPILTTEILSLAGRAELVKVNTEEEPALAARFGIQGIPAVKAFRKGRIVAEFVGARDSSFVRSWLSAIVPSKAKETLDRADRALSKGEASAESDYRLILDDREVGQEAALGLAKALFARQALDEAALVLDRIDASSHLAQGAEAMRRRMRFASDAAGFGGEDLARARLDSDPSDLEARYALASALAARGDLEAALEEFLTLVSKNRKFRSDAARLAMLALFDQLGADHPLTHEFRRRLQIVL